MKVNIIKDGEINKEGESIVRQVIVGAQDLCD